MIKKMSHKDFLLKSVLSVYISVYELIVFCHRTANWTFFKTFSSMPLMDQVD